MPAPRNKFGRSTARRMRVQSMVETKLTDARVALDALVKEAAKGRSVPELWKGLHDAALRDDMVLEVSFAYEQLIGGRQLKQLAPDAQARVLMGAATFFDKLLGDEELAETILERVLGVAPTHAEAFSMLERKLLAARKEARLAELYANAAAHSTERHAQLLCLRRAATLVERLPTSEQARAISICERLVATDPSNAWLRKNLEGRYIRARRFRDLAALLDRTVAGAAALQPGEARAIREQLIGLYLGDARDCQRAIAHVEALLRDHPHSEEGRKAAEKLLTEDAVAARAAAALQERRRRIVSAQ